MLYKLNFENDLNLIIYNIFYGKKLLYRSLIEISEFKGTRSLIYFLITSNLLIFFVLAFNFS